MEGFGWESNGVKNKVSLHKQWLGVLQWKVQWFVQSSYDNKT